MGFDSMNVSVTNLSTKQQSRVELGQGSIVTDLLKQLQLKAHATIVLLNNKPIPEDDLIIDGGKYQVLPVASGG